MVWSMFYYFVIIVASLLLLWHHLRRKKVPHPPGPPADPIIGHLRVMPQSNPDVVFRDMSKAYGDILYFHIPGRSYLILNSLKSALELLDQRSGIYSDRIWLPILELMGWSREMAVAMMPYGKRFQKHRRLLNEYLHEKQCTSYRLMQTRYAHHLINRLIDNPMDWEKHLERFSAEIIVKIAYGKDIIDNDPYLNISEKAIRSLISCGSPGATPVDFFPFLQYFPSWFPGTYYAFKARSFYPAVRDMHTYPFESVQQEMRAGTAKPSYTAYHLERLHGTTPDEEHIQDLQGSATQLFIAGAETTSTALCHFLLAMVLFPDIQRKAQQEIDSVIGWSRLPELGDRESLPYVRAVLSEMEHNGTAMYDSLAFIDNLDLQLIFGAPHRSTEDDIYRGMYIPKGTIVIANTYAILRDETIYSNPNVFNPSRYLPRPEGNAEPHPIGHFGFGRRLCPGQYLADGSLFIAIVSILATMNIERAKDDNGREIVPQVELMTGVTSRPKPFPCVIKPRNSASESLARQALLFDES